MTADTRKTAGRKAENPAAVSDTDETEKINKKSKEDIFQFGNIIMKMPALLGCINGYAAGGAVRFHMPGHKGGADFAKIFGGAAADITELSFSDCLHSPSGVIKQAEENVASALGAGRSFIVTDGSTAALHAMIYALRGRGKKLAIPRISHKSVYNGLLLAGLEPVFIPVEDDDGLPVQKTAALDEILSAKDVAGALVVSPDYYGNVPDLAAAKAACDRHGKPLLVDGAHGGHLHFARPQAYAGNYASVWVDGVHKTLPSLTQAAIVNVNDVNLTRSVEEALGVFLTTSPSYPIMASAEFGVLYGRGAGKPAFDRLHVQLSSVAEKAEELGYVFRKVDDPAKLVLDAARSGIEADAFTRFAEAENLYFEMNDGRFLVFMASPMNGDGDFERLSKILSDYRAAHAKVPFIAQKPRFWGGGGRRVMDYAQAVNAPWERVSIENAAGRIAAADMGIFPPCFPLVTAGEIIGREEAAALARAENTFGTEGGVKAVKEQDE